MAVCGRKIGDTMSMAYCISFSNLVHRVAQGLSSLEGRGVRGGDGDGLAGARVATFAGWACLRRKCPESGDSDGLPRARALEIVENTALTTASAADLDSEACVATCGESSDFFISVSLGIVDSEGYPDRRCEVPGWISTAIGARRIEGCQDVPSAGVSAAP